MKASAMAVSVGAGRGDFAQALTRDAAVELRVPERRGWPGGPADDDGDLNGRAVAGDVGRPVLSIARPDELPQVRPPDALPAPCAALRGGFRRSREEECLNDRL